MTSDIDQARRGELSNNLAQTRTRIDQACRAAGRQPDDVTLIAVTKTYPAADLAALVDLGVTDVGENRDQEAAGKVGQVRSTGRSFTFHFIGQLQTNKASSVARYADVVQSVDRERLASALGRAAVSHGRELGILVQVDLDPAPADGHRGGVPCSGAVGLAEMVAQTEGLRLDGVMAVAPLCADPAEAFSRLEQVAGEVQSRFPAARTISAGMSADLESAIKYGATHVRVGTAILGSRPPLR